MNSIETQLCANDKQEVAVDLGLGSAMNRTCTSCNRMTDWEFCPYCGGGTLEPAPARDKPPISRQQMVRVLALSIVGAIALIGFCWLVYRPHRDDEAVKVIRAAGGEVTRESRLGIVAGFLDASVFPYGAAFDVDCRNIRIDASVVEAISSLPEVSTWDCFSCVFEPDAFKHLYAMPNLRALNLTDSNIGDSDLVYLRAMENLELLSLDKSNVSDKGIVHLAALKKLRVVNLGGTKVTQTGREHLKTLLPNVEIRD
jgi:hypothetical protein